MWRRVVVTAVGLELFSDEQNNARSRSYPDGLQAASASRVASSFFRFNLLRFKKAAGAQLLTVPPKPSRWTYRPYGLILCTDDICQLSYAAKLTVRAYSWLTGTNRVPMRCDATLTLTLTPPPLPGDGQSCAGLPPALLAGKRHFSEIIR